MAQFDWVRKNQTTKNQWKISKYTNVEPKTIPKQDPNLLKQMLNRSKK